MARLKPERARFGVRRLDAAFVRRHPPQTPEIVHDQNKRHTEALFQRAKQLHRQRLDRRIERRRRLVSVLDTELQIEEEKKRRNADNRPSN
jgi:hypothetical protein